MKMEVSDPKVNTALTAMLRALKNLTPVYKAIGNQLERNVQLRYDLQEAPDGTDWAAWAPSTAKSRAKERRGTLMSYTGRMRTSFTSVARSDSVSVGFGVDYAGYHEFGTKRMPARPLLLDNGALSDDDSNDILLAAVDAFKKAIKAPK